jgi:hypothetical protein
MHRFIFALAASSALIVSGPVFAQHGHGGPATTPTAHGQSTTHGSSGTTTHGNSGATTHGQSGSHGPATKPTSSTTTHGSGNTHASGGGNPHSTGGTSTTTKSGTTATGTSPTTTGTGSTVPLTPVQQKLQKNTNLADKLRTRLPANTDLMDAAKGFRNLGQFVAAVNVSNNLGLDFTQLKTRMVDDGMSLGQAIQKEKTTVNVETEVRRAETEADSMIKSSSTSTATPQPFPTPTTTTKKAKKTSGNQ